MSLHEILNRIFDLQPKWAKKGKETLNMKKRKEAIGMLELFLKEKLKKTLDDLSFKVKSGGKQGRVAQVPWVSFYHPSFSNGSQQGYYLVYLFSMDGERLYLSLNQGATIGKDQDSPPKHVLPMRVDAAKEVIVQKNLLSDSTQYLSEIDLLNKAKNISPTDNTKNYQNAHVFGLEYSKDNLPDEQKILSDLEQLCTLQKSIYKSMRNFWIYSPGEGASLWKENLDIKEMRMGDLKQKLSSFNNQENLEKKITEERSGTARPTNDLKAYWQLAYEMNVGDVIIAKKGRNTYLGYGLVTTNYIYDDKHETYYHSRGVNWKKDGQWEEELGPIVAKTLTNITDLKSESTEHEYYVDRLRALIGIPEDLDRSADQVLGINWLTETTHLKKDFLEEIVEELESPKGGQIILAGPPGTGKTWVAEHLAKYLTKDNENLYKVVQFHPSYGYEDFVEGLRPQIKDGGKLIFEPTHGHVLKIAKIARENPSNNYVLVLDEINRANLPKVLGELLYLLEYREKKIDLQYSPNFSLPQNLKFVGTMNTADRSIRSIDAAIRRRFNFFDLNPSLEVLKSHHLLNDESEFLKGFKSLNESLVKDYDEHHAIGHSYFMGCYCRGDLEKVWKREIFPLLQEYFIDWSKEELEGKYSIEKFWGDWKKNDPPKKS
jgi:5-methylcytosine-specific restriction enzyme B